MFFVGPVPTPPTGEIFYLFVPCFHFHRLACRHTFAYPTVGSLRRLKKERWIRKKHQNAFTIASLWHDLHEEMPRGSRPSLLVFYGVGDGDEDAVWIQREAFSMATSRGAQ